MQSLIGGDIVNQAREPKFQGATVLDSATRPCLRSWSDGESPIYSPVQNAPHEDIPSKTHGLVADSKTSKTVAPRIDAFL